MGLIMYDQNREIIIRLYKLSQAGIVFIEFHCKIHNIFLIKFIFFKRKDTKQLLLVLAKLLIL